MERVEGSEVAVVTPVGKDTPITKLSGSYQNIPPNLSSKYRSTPPPYYYFTLAKVVDNFTNIIVIQSLRKKKSLALGIASG